jgi:ubiquinone/menaquinone biosynthesis C-methylase UbiE
MPLIFSEDSQFITLDERKNRWAIPYHYECLNARTQNLLWSNVDSIKGKRVLDLGCHMGTFSYAAWKMGADFVCGIDSEEETIARGKKTFRHYNVPEDQYRLSTGDVFRYLESLEPNQFDTIFCFGLLYYVEEPYTLLKLICKVAKETVLLDTFTSTYAAIQGKEAVQFQKMLESGNAIEMPLLLVALTQSKKKTYKLPQSHDTGKKKLSLTCFPTSALLERWFLSLETEFTKISWKDFIQGNCQWQDLIKPEAKKRSHWADLYACGTREAYRITKHIKG